MSDIHPLAHVDPGARIASDVNIGPFCYVGRDVTLGPGCRLLDHVSVHGPATIGARNTFYPFSVIGAAPQDLKYKGGSTSVEIGDDNVFREHVTVHRGTEIDPLSGGVTRIGNHNLLMVGAHVAHDVQIENHIVIANAVLIAGHVHVEPFVNIGGGSAIHHFVTIGRYAQVGGMTRVQHDVPPCMRVVGYDAAVRAVNTIGLRRWHVDESSVAALKRAFRLLYARKRESQRRRMLTPGHTIEALRMIESDGLANDAYVACLVEFLRRKHEVGVYGRQRQRERRDTDADRESFYQASAVGGVS